METAAYELNGHLRPFFSPAYARACLDPGSTILELKEQRGDLYGHDSAYIEAIVQAV